MAELNGTSLKSLTTLKAYYRFEGNLNDSSGNGFNLSGSTSPTSEPTGGVYGGSYNWNGTTNYAGATLTGLTPFNGAYTISVWIKPETVGEGAPGDYANIIDFGGKSVLKINAESGDNIQLRFYQIFTSPGSWNTDGYVVPKNQWTHVAVVYDGSSTSNNAVIYINGESVAVTEGSTPSGTIETSTSLHIGNNGASGIRAFDGSMDDIGIWSQALTADQVSVLYSSTVQTVTLVPSADVYMDSNNPTSNRNGFAFLQAGEWNGGAAVLRSLLKFDLSTLNSSDSIKSSVFTIWDNGTDYTDNARTMNAYRMLRTWVEDQATWNVYSTGNNWGTAGAGNTTTDRESSSMGGVLLPNPPVEKYYGFSLTSSLVNDWINGGLTNNGFLLQMEIETNDAHEFSDSTVVGEGPKLIIDYEPGATTSTPSGYAFFM